MKFFCFIETFSSYFLFTLTILPIYLCRTFGVSKKRGLKEQQQQSWQEDQRNKESLDSRAFTVSGKLKPEDAVQATLSSLPDEVVDTVGVTALLSEDSVSERRRKLEYLEMQEELIKEEEEKEEEELARMKESKARKEDVALK
ncbi:uncharacterized protein [Gossypium hirsutum]|uniref:Uncharacterized protein n=1 Tax=Gossypium hirsutum TaxID=3635 RepID=A0ABM3BCA4_GOSHI|nr:uncharacterized protein LOC121225036 [Gossypium hirsutum]